MMMTKTVTPAWMMPAAVTATAPAAARRVLHPPTKSVAPAGLKLFHAAQQRALLQQRRRQDCNALEHPRDPSLLSCWFLQLSWLWLTSNTPEAPLPGQAEDCFRVAGVTCKLANIATDFTTTAFSTAQHSALRLQWMLLRLCPAIWAGLRCHSSSSLCAGPHFFTIFLSLPCGTACAAVCTGHEDVEVHTSGSTAQARLQVVCHSWPE